MPSKASQRWQWIIFGRTAGLTPRDESFKFRPHVQQLRAPSVFADAQAVLDHLATDGSRGTTFVVGFCLGGSLALGASTQEWGLGGSIAFYAGMSRALDDHGRTALDLVAEARTPVLGLFGGADQGIPPEQVEALDRALDGAGVEHEIKIYPGALHSFFDRRAHEFEDASADAWPRMLDFIAARTGAVS